MTAHTDTRKFAAYLSFDDETEHWRLRSIDITQAGLQHKVSYPALPLLQDALIDTISKDVLAQLAQMNRSGDMMSNSGYVLDLPGVRFQKLRVHTSFSFTRGVEASFWFGSLNGQPLLALRHYSESFAGPSALTQGDKRAGEAGNRMALPPLQVVASGRR